MSTLNVDIIQSASASFVTFDSEMRSIHPLKINQILPEGGVSVEINGTKVSGATTSLNIGNSIQTPLGLRSVHIGVDSGHVASPASDYNVTIGYYSGKLLSTGSNNTFVGGSSGQSMVSGIQNTFVGKLAGANATSNSNTCVGDNAGQGISTGNSNTFIGAGSGNTPFVFTGNNVTCIGKNSIPSAADASFEITLGDVNSETLRCAVTSITSLSDARDKKDITELSAGLDFVKTLKPVEFVWDTRDGSKKDIKDFGFIAQDLKAAQEESGLAETLKLVYESNPDKLEASYGKLVPILVKAMQEMNSKMSSEIDSLKKEINELKNK